MPGLQRSAPWRAPQALRYALANAVRRARRASRRWAQRPTASRSTTSRRARSSATTSSRSGPREKVRWICTAAALAEVLVLAFVPGVVHVSERVLEREHPQAAKVSLIAPQVVVRENRRTHT